MSALSCATAAFRSGALSLSRVRFGGNHIYLGRYHDYNQWEYLPHPSLQASQAILPVGASYVKAPFNRVLRGSGLHGPECPEVLRLTLWNRLRQRRLQREVPTEEQMREFNKLEVACVWFTWSILLFLWPLTVVGKNYAKEHDHFPWTPARTDGSRGEGPFWWMLE